MTADDVVCPVRGVRLERGRLEPADRHACGSRREDPDGLRVIQTDADRFAKRQWPGLLSECREERSRSAEPAARRAAGRGATLGASALGLFGSCAATRATVPTPAATKTRAQITAAVIVNLLKNMDFNTPLTSTRN